MFFAEVGCQSESQSCGLSLPHLVLQCLTGRVNPEAEISVHTTSVRRPVRLPPHSKISRLCYATVS
jgi:hypothetical protein